MTTQVPFYTFGWKFNSIFLKKLVKTHGMKDESDIVEHLHKLINDKKYLIKYPQKYYDEEPFGSFDCFLSMYVGHDKVNLDEFKHIKCPTNIKNMVVDEWSNIYISSYDFDRMFFV